MPIPVAQETDDTIFTEYWECCIFCGLETSYWIESVNRPCCPECSVKFEPEDIDQAKFNY